MSADVIEAIDSAVEKRIKKAYLTALVSIGVALISLAGAIYSAWIESDTQEKLQNMEVRVQMSAQAITRAEKVATEYENLLSATQGENKRLAFLNLWHLNSGDEHRRLLLLTGLQFAGKDVFDLLMVLTPELENYEDVFATLTNSRECQEDALSRQTNDCGTNEFAKKLLSKLNPEKALGLLLEDMAERPLTSRDNVNLDILRQLIETSPDLTEQLLRQYRDGYSDMLGLSYLLYQNGILEPFREVLEGDHTVEERIKLVEFLSGWPLTDLEAADRESLITFLNNLLNNVEAPRDFAPVLKTVRKVHKHINDDQRAKFSGRIAELLTQEDMTWTIRSAAAEALAAMDLRTLLEMLLKLDVPEGDTMLPYSLARTLRRNHRELVKLYPEATPPTTDDLGIWQDWIKEAQSG